jgi:hypothetical protein
MPAVFARVVTARQLEECGRAVDDDKAQMLGVPRVDGATTLFNLESQCRESRHTLPEPRGFVFSSSPLGKSLGCLRVSAARLQVGLPSSFFPLCKGEPNSPRAGVRKTCCTLELLWARAGESKAGELGAQVLACATTSLRDRARPPTGRGAIIRAQLFAPPPGPTLTDVASATLENREPIFVGRRALALAQRRHWRLHGFAVDPLEGLLGQRRVPITVALLDRDPETACTDAESAKLACHSVSRVSEGGRTGGLYRSIRTCVTMRDPRSRVLFERA